MKTSKASPLPPIRTLCKLGWHDVYSDRWNSLLWIVVHVAVSLAVLCPQFYSDLLYLNSARAFQAQFAQVWVITNGPHGISSQGCANLTSLPAVRHAGAVRQMDQHLVAQHTPRQSVDYFEYTGSFLNIFNTDTTSTIPTEHSTPGLVLTPSVATLWGRIPGSSVTIDNNSFPIGATISYPENSSYPALDVAALSAGTPAEDYSACFIDVWPYSAEALSVAKSQAASPFSSVESVQASQLVSQFGQQFTWAGYDALKIMPIAYLASIGCVGALFLHTRRLHFALQIHLGCDRKAGVFFIFWFRWMVISLCAQTLTALVTAILSYAWHHSISWPWPHDIVAPVLLSSIAGTVGVAVRAQFIHQRNLYKYVRRQK